MEDTPSEFVTMILDNSLLLPLSVWPTAPPPMWVRAAMMALTLTYLTFWLPCPAGWIGRGADFLARSLTTLDYLIAIGAKLGLIAWALMYVGLLYDHFTNLQPDEPCEKLQ